MKLKPLLAAARSAGDAMYAAAHHGPQSPSRGGYGESRNK
eukprot:gene12095-biopygen5667